MAKTFATRRGFLMGLGVGVGLGGLLRWRGDVLYGGQALVRPPGALPESEFLAACLRCGQCVEACPFDTLHMAEAGDGIRVGTPYVKTREIPCCLCQGYDTLLCVAACPTKALSPVADLADIHMGTAIINEDLCFAYNRVVCRACWHICPFPDKAIVFDDLLRPVVKPEACIGCGLCDHACPTEPSSIPIRPASQGDTVPKLLSDDIFASSEENCGTGVSPVGTRAGRPCHNWVAAEGRSRVTRCEGGGT